MSKEEVIREALASAPPTAVSALTVAGIGLQDWVLILTLIWLVCQIGYFAWRRFKGMRD